MIEVNEYIKMVDWFKMIFNVSKDEWNEIIINELLDHHLNFNTNNDILRPIFKLYKIHPKTHCCYVQLVDSAQEIYYLVMRLLINQH